MRSLLRTASAFALVASVSAPALAADYVIDTAHTTVGFQVRHLAAKVRGQFNTFNGQFSFDPASPDKAAGNIEIDTSSIDTNQAKRDAHLRSPDFFETDKFPKMTYVIKGAKKQGKEYVLNGDLTIRGVTKQVPLKVTALGEAVDPWGNKSSAFVGVAKINRKDFGLNWNKALEAGGVLVGEEVEIEINVEANPKPAEASAK